MNLADITPTRILWVDLEMTSLNPKVDRIVEVAAIVTDWQFKELASFESGVGQDADEIKPLLDQSPFMKSHPENVEVFLEYTKSAPPEDKVEEVLLQLIDEHFAKDEPVLLAGNSIHTDRQFIRHWWPRFEGRLHYRMLDVSAWKVVMQGRYGLEFEKKKSHRALDDIRESIAELEYYLGFLNVSVTEKRPVKR